MRWWEKKRLRGNPAEPFFFGFLAEVQRKEGEEATTPEYAQKGPAENSTGPGKRK
jgi:hypothetical protein